MIYRRKYGWNFTGIIKGVTMTGTLYLCATPIGNLEDMTYRVVRTLKEVDLIGAEDTRNSRKLLNYFEIKTPMTSYHENNKYDKARTLIAKMQEGKNVALITDAGTPGISDPGEELVRQCYEAGITVTSLPGAAACVTALVMSGQETGRFCFEAFLPHEKKERVRRLEELKNETRTIVLYEAPHRLVKTLHELLEALGNRSVTLCRELTKRYEEGIRTTISEALSLYQEKEPKGEYVLVIAGKPQEELEEEQRKKWEAMTIEEHIDYYTEQGYDKKQAMKLAAKDRGVSKRDIYNELLS